MGKTRQDYVNQAKKWIGYNEEDGSYKKIIDTYNKGLSAAVKKWGTRNIKMAYDWEWCSCFVSACAIAAGCADIVPIEIACICHREIAQEFGIWVENDGYTPNPGDLILYDWDDNGVGDNRGSEDHIGIVEKVEGSKITVIEGNSGGRTDYDGEYLGTVCRHTRYVNGQYIRGYIVPKFANSNSSNSKSKSSTSKKKKSLEEIAAEVWQGKWGNGDDRKKRLTEAGYDYNAVQSLVNKQSQKKTEKAADRVHTVSKGDTLWSIGKKYGVSYQKIAKHNGISDPSLIYPGQKIRIPKS